MKRKQSLNDRVSPMAVALTLMAFLTIGIALGDTGAGAGPPYNYWTGNVAVNYSNGSTTTDNVQSKFPQVPTALGTEVVNDFNSTACTVLEDSFAQAAGVSVPIPDWSCDLPSSLDLQAQPSTNGVDLDILAAGVKGSLDDQGATINGTVNVNLAIDLAISSSINGADSPSCRCATSGPLSISSSDLTFSDADFSSSNVFVTDSDLDNAESYVNSDTVPGVASELGLPGQIATLDGQLHAGAAYLAKTYVLPSDPSANKMFNVSVQVNSSQLLLTFTRGNLEQLPTGCGIYAPFSEVTYGDYTFVSAECSYSQPQGVTELQLQEDDNGTWNVGPSPSAPAGGPTFDASTFFQGTGYPWQPNTEEVVAQPYMIHYVALQPGKTTVSMRVCSVNSWGDNCLAPVTVVQATVPPPVASTGGTTTGTNVNNDPPIKPISGHVTMY